MDSDPASVICWDEQATRDYDDTDHFVCRSEAPSGFQFVLELSNNRTQSLISIVGFSHSYRYLANTDQSACTKHTQRVVEAVEHAFALYQMTEPNNLIFIWGCSKDSEHLADQGHHSAASAISRPELNLQDILSDPITQVNIVTCGYMRVDGFGKRSYLNVAGCLGVFSAALVICIRVRRVGDSNSFYAHGRDTLTTIQNKSFKIDLHHATLLKGVLIPFVCGSYMPNLQVPGLIEMVGRRVGIMLPRSHVEQPDLHRLLAISLKNDQRRRLAPEKWSLNWLPVIERFYVALKSMPDRHPSQLACLAELASALRISALPDISSTKETRILCPEACCWKGVIQALDSDTGAASGEEFRPSAAIMDEINEMIRIGKEASPRFIEELLPYLKNYFEPLWGPKTHLRNPRSIESMLDHLSIFIHRCESISSSLEYTDQIAEIFQLAHTQPSDARISQSVLDFGLGSALSRQATLRADLGSHDANEIYRLQSEGITYLTKSMDGQLEAPSTSMDLKKLAILGSAFACRHKTNVWLYRDREDLETAIRLFRDAAAKALSLRIDPLTLRFIGESWVNTARDFEHGSVVEAYGFLISSLARFSWVGVDIQTRCNRIRFSNHKWVPDGIACACHYGIPNLGVEFLEAGSSILFSQTIPLHERNSALCEMNPELALELERVGNAIHHRSFRRHEPLLDSSGGGSMTPADQRIKHSYELRCLGSEWEDLLSRVRLTEGYQDISETPPLEKLCQAALRGPVVLVTSSQAYNACYAIVISHPSTFSQEFNDALTQKFLRMRIDNNDEARGFKKYTVDAEKPEEKAHVILAQLWRLAMKPVIEVVYQSLGLDIFNKSLLLPHVWVRATGFLSSLPLHAAGEYRTNGAVINDQCVLDHIICSYTPSLSALLREPPRNATPTNIFILSGGQGLSHTSEEANIVHSIWESRAIVESLSGRTATGDQVREMVRDAHIAHFACHGVQDPADPLKSRLSFSNTSQLELLELMREPLPKARLAVLLACETAQGDEVLTEEALHIAGTMLFAGFRSAIGSLWRMKDVDGPKICADFYNALLEGDSQTIDYNRVGLALHTAVCKLRDSGVGVFRWATFVHIGQ